MQRDVRQIRVEVDGLPLDLAYTHEPGRSSPGSPLLLVHGFLACHRTFGSIIDPLAERGEVWAIDLPGFGRSSCPSPRRAPYDAAWFARVVLAFADAVGVERFALLGHSMGGAIAQEVARQAPRRVQHLVLVSSVGPGGLPRLAALAAIPLVGRAIFAVFLVALALIARLTRQTPVRTAAPAAWATLQRLLRPFARRSAGGLGVATTLVCGRRDGVVPVRASRTLARVIDRAKLELLEDVGHFPASQAPRRLVSAVHRAIDRPWTGELQALPADSRRPSLGCNA